MRKLQFPSFLGCEKQRFQLATNLLYRAKGSLIFTGATAALRGKPRLLRLHKGKLEFDFWRKAWPENLDQRVYMSHMSSSMA